MLKPRVCCHLFIVFLTLLVVLSVCSSSPAEPHRRSRVRRVLVSHDSDNYAVIFDAGSTGSRVHVFRFNQNLELLPIGNDIDFFLSIKPGLSSYESDPKAAANSLEPLLQKAEAVVPKDLHSQTPLKLGATAGLRLLKGDAAEKILQAVRDLLKNETTLKQKAEWVSVLDGTQEGSYFWVALNYLFGNLGKKYPSTSATIDLGGGSVQMAYALLSKESEANGESSYVQQKSFMGTDYNLYVHSYLNYGQLAGRAEIFKASRNSSNPCIMKGHDVTYRASPPPNGANLRRCRALVYKALKVDTPCKYKKCTFGGVWSGGGGNGMNNLYASSFFYDIAVEGGIIDSSKLFGKVRPTQYQNAAKVACNTKVEDVKSKFPNVKDKDIPYICMDLMYDFSLLVDGFGLDPYKEITMVHSVEYKKYIVGAAWPLGCAIDVISSST